MSTDTALGLSSGADKRQHAGRASVGLGRRSAMAILAMLGIVFGSLALVPSSASAATQGGYPTASVAFGASTRTAPRVRSNTYWGYAYRNPNFSSNQTVSVSCYYDGDWATGNYSSNRWFRVLVWESYDGYNTPRWLFVHASYVYNQPSVGPCGQPAWQYA